jgi:hypothetical protein
VALTSFVCMVWASSDLYLNPALVYVALTCMAATLCLIVTGVVLLICRQTKQGWIALGFAAYGALFLFIFLPMLAE